MGGGDCWRGRPGKGGLQQPLGSFGRMRAAEQEKRRFKSAGTSKGWSSIIKYHVVLICWSSRQDW